MKRVLIMLVAIVLSFSCCAETVNLDGMSLQELIDLDFQVRQKITEIDMSSEGILYSGIYDIGTALEAGQYLFKCIDLSGSNLRAVVKLVNPEEHSIIDDARIDPDEVHYFNALEGLQIRIDEGTVLYIKK